MTTTRYLAHTIVLGSLLLLWGCNAVSHKGGLPHADHADIPEGGRAAAAGEQTMALDLRNAYGLDSIMPALFDSRVVFVGEQHDNYAHHLAQLEVIRRLYEQAPDLAIGMEMFQRPFQPHLDAYLAGEISESEMLRRTEWYERWRFDFRLYKPILDFAKRNGIPVIALNVEREMTEKVSQGGLAGLSDEERVALPRQIDRGDKVYEARLKEIFAMHPNSEDKEFEHFVESQLLWDETMAQRTADHLQAHPGRRMVVLAGNGHLMYGSGVPNRVVRRLPVRRAIVLPGDAQPVKADVADFLIFPPAAQLPKAGLMGLLMDPTEEGVRVQAVLEGKAAEQAGVKKGDLLKSIDRQEIHNATDVRIHMQDKRPGDRIALSVVREGLLFGEEQLEFEIELGE